MNLSLITTINVDAALENVGQKTTLLEKLLMHVAKDEKDFGKQFCQTITEDKASADRLAHSLKSTLAMIGAEQIHPLAVELDACCKAESSEENLCQQAQQIELLLNNLIQEINMALDTQETVIDNLEIEADGFQNNPTRLSELHQTLLQAVKESDTKACHLISQLVAACPETYRNQYRYIQTQIDQYDFEEALIWLTKMDITTHDFSKQGS